MGQLVRFSKYFGVFLKEPEKWFSFLWDTGIIVRSIFILHLQKEDWGRTTHGSVRLLFAHSRRDEITRWSSGQAGACLHQRCPPGLPLPVKPSAWAASVRGGSRDRGLQRQPGVTSRLCQGLEVELSGWEERFTAPLLARLQCIKRALEERRCL